MNISVQLRRDVHDLGRAGQIVNVSQAYARNFLIPKGFAVLATPKVIAAAKQRVETKAADQAKQHRLEEQAKTSLTGIKIQLSGRASSSGKLFAAIKSEQVFDAIATQTGFPMKAGTKITPSVFKTTGDHPTTIILAGTPVLFTVHIDHADR